MTSSLQVSDPIKVKIPDTNKFTIHYSDDKKSAGVSILYSDTAEQKLKSFGSEGERISFIESLYLQDENT